MDNIEGTPRSSEVLASQDRPRFPRVRVLAAAAVAAVVLGGWAVVVHQSPPAAYDSAASTPGSSAGPASSTDPASTTASGCLTPPPGSPRATGRGPAIIVGGRQVLRVDVTTGGVRALSPCADRSAVRVPLESLAGAWTTSDASGVVLHLPGDGSHPGTDRRFPRLAEVRSGLPGHVLVAVADDTEFVTRYRVDILDGRGRTLSRMLTAPAIAVLGETAAGVVVMTRNDPYTYTVLSPRDGHRVRSFGTGAFALGVHADVAAWLPLRDTDSVLPAGDGQTIYQCERTCPDLKLTDVTTGRTTAVPALPNRRIPLQASASPTGHRVLVTVSAYGGDRHDGAVLVVDKERRTTRELRGLRDIGSREGGTAGPMAVWGPDGAVYIAERTEDAVRLLRWLPDDDSPSTLTTLHGDAYGLTLTAEITTGTSERRESERPSSPGG